MNTVLEMSNDSSSSFHLQKMQMQRNHIKSSNSKRLSPNLKTSQMNIAAGRDPQSHRIIEKRRRDRMNSCLADLSKLIPNHMFNKRGKGRVEKTEIVEMAIRHLKFLTNSLTGLASSNSAAPSQHSPDIKSNNNHTFQNQNDKMANRSFRPDVVENESYQLGFKECLSETLRFLVEFEGFSLNQDFVQYPGSQSCSPPQPTDKSVAHTNGSGGGGGGFHLTKLVAHLNSHLERVVESRLKHPQEMSEMTWSPNQFSALKNNSFEIKVTTAEEINVESDTQMDDSGYELRQMLLPDSKKNPFPQNSTEEMNLRRDMVESPVLSVSSQSKGSYKKEIKDRFLRMRVESGNEVNDGSGGNQDRSNKIGDGPTGSVSTFFSSSASSSSGSSNGSLSSNSSTSSFPVFHPNNRGRSYSVNTYGPLCTKNVLQEIQEQKERSFPSSPISVFGFALHPSRSYYIPFHSKTTNLHESLTNALLEGCNSSNIDQNLRNLYPVSISVKFDSNSELSN